jgi:hypothetical protein
MKCELVTVSRTKFHQNLLKRFKIYVKCLYMQKVKTELRGFGPRRTIPTERPPLVGEVSASFYG